MAKSPTAPDVFVNTRPHRLHLHWGDWEMDTDDHSMSLLYIHRNKNIWRHEQKRSFLSGI